MQFCLNGLLECGGVTILFLEVKEKAVPQVDYVGTYGSLKPS